MPLKNTHGIDVSAEEERYLRKAFRRFALPYVLVFAGLVWVVSLLSASGGGGASSESVAALEAEAERLGESVTSLEERLESIRAELSKTGARISSLEDSRRQGRPTALDPALEGELRDAARRVEKLENQLTEQAAGERLDALASRMTRLEGELRAVAPAAPAPNAPGMAPGPPTAP